MARHLTLALLVAATALVPGAARADIFKLKSGGEVRGELVNADESPREKYVIRPYSGGELTLQKEVVSQVVRQRPNQVEYEKAKLTLEDTVAGQWKMAEWCHENKLENDRNTHLRRIIELDPDHAEARKLLGYARVGERWLTLEERMKEEGRVKYKNQWVPAHQLELIQQREADAKSQQQWHKKLSQYRTWLEGERAGAGKRAILEITDKSADKPLISKLKGERDVRVRELYAQALANLATPDAVATIVDLSLNDTDRSFRSTCFELIEKGKPKEALALYVKALGDKDSNIVVNRAGRGLGRLGDQEAVRPLIEALVTKHKYIINTGGGGPGSISPSFGRNANGSGWGSSGLSSGGGGPKVVYKNHNNDEVLAALVKLTGQDFDFDIPAWRSWYGAAKQQQQPVGNARRN